MPSQVDCTGWYELEFNNCRAIVHDVQVRHINIFRLLITKKSNLKIHEMLKSKFRFLEIDDVFREFSLRQNYFFGHQNFKMDPKGVHETLCDV